ncbi:MAG: YIP1 family protein [Acidobacteriota bacterium]
MTDQPPGSPPQPPSGPPPAAPPPPAPPGGAAPPPSGGAPPPPMSPPPGGGGYPPGGSPPVPPMSGGPTLPWDDRERIGIPNALIETAKLIATDPTEAFRRVREDGDFIGPIIYALIFGVAGAIVSQLWNMLFGNAMTAMLGGGLGDMMASTGSGMFGAIVGILAAPIYVLIGLFVGAGIIHLSTMVVGIANQSPNGFEGTFKIAAFVQTVQVAVLVPVIGPFAAGIWAIVLWVIGIMQVHRADSTKAVIAVLLPVVLCCVCMAIGGFMFGAGIAGLASQAQ